MREQIPPISGNPDFSVRRNRHPRQFWAEQIADQRRRRNKRSGPQTSSNELLAEHPEKVRNSHSAIAAPPPPAFEPSGVADYIGWVIANPELAARESANPDQVVAIYQAIDSTPPDVNNSPKCANSKLLHDQLV